VGHDHDGVYDLRDRGDALANCSRIAICLGFCNCCCADLDLRGSVDRSEQPENPEKYLMWTLAGLTVASICLRIIRPIVSRRPLQGTPNDWQPTSAFHSP
jgi:hypothetical protein